MVTQANVIRSTTAPIEDPTDGEGATCQSCTNCPWIGMNSFHNLVEVIQHGTNEIQISKDLLEKAKTPIMRMLDFAKKQ